MRKVSFVFVNNSPLQTRGGVVIKNITHITVTLNTYLRNGYQSLELNDNLLMALFQVIWYTSQHFGLTKGVTWPLICWFWYISFKIYGQGRNLCKKTGPETFSLFFGSTVKTYLDIFRKLVPFCIYFFCPWKLSSLWKDLYRVLLGVYLCRR